MSAVANKFIVDGSYEDKIPEIKAWSMEEDAYYFTNALSDNPTVEELDKLCEEIPTYELQRGGRCGWTALAVAIEKQAFPLIQAILDKDPRLVNASWDICSPYIVHAASMTDPEFALKLVKEFVKRGADVNLADPDGWTALFNSSAKKTHSEVTKFLLKQGAVIYKSAREEVIPLNWWKIITLNWWPEQIREEARKQPENLERAIKEITAVNMFRNGVLTKGESVISCLPAEIRAQICSFLD